MTTPLFSIVGEPFAAAIRMPPALDTSASPPNATLDVCLSVDGVSTLMAVMAPPIQPSTVAARFSRPGVAAAACSPAVSRRSPPAESRDWLPNASVSLTVAVVAERNFATPKAPTEPPVTLLVTSRTVVVPIARSPAAASVTLSFTSTSVPTVAFVSDLSTDNAAPPPPQVPTPSAIRTSLVGRIVMPPVVPVCRIAAPSPIATFEFVVTVLTLPEVPLPLAEMMPPPATRAARSLPVR